MALAMTTLAKSRKSRAGGARGRPSRKEEAEITNLILETAARLFLSEGYAAISMSRIGKEATVAPNTLYARFSNKAALFSAVVEWKVEAWKLLKPVRRFPPGTPLEKILEGCAINMLEASEQDDIAAFGRLLSSEGHAFPELLRIYGQTAMEVGKSESLEELMNAADVNLTVEEALELQGVLRQCVSGCIMLRRFGDPENCANIKDESKKIARILSKIVSR